MVEPDPDHGLRGTTTSSEFIRGFGKLVTDVALGKASSRTLNTNKDIRAYFNTWDSKDHPARRQGSFVPSDVIKGRSVASSAHILPTERSSPKTKSLSKKVLPRDFKVRFGNDRLVDICRELKKLTRYDFPNAGAVLLRVFFELAVVDYLERIGELTEIKKKLEAKGVPIPYGTPTMRQLLPEVARIAKAQLPKEKATRVEKAIRYDPAAPFTISDLHAFVHSSADYPSERDIFQFWARTEPLFRMMLELEPVKVTQ
jgi:hypothetical protein